MTYFEITALMVVGQCINFLIAFNIWRINPKEIIHPNSFTWFNWMTIFIPFIIVFLAVGLFVELIWKLSLEKINTEHKEKVRGLYR